MSRTDEATAATQSVVAEALDQACVAVEGSLSTFARALLGRVAVETASCIAREFIKGGIGRLKRFGCEQSSCREIGKLRERVVSPGLSEQPLLPNER